MGIFDYALEHAITTRCSRDGDTTIISRVQDIEPILEANKKRMNESSALDSWGDGQLVARIPMVLLDKWRNEEGFDIFKVTEAELNRRLNDHENTLLRVRKGVL